MASVSVGSGREAAPAVAKLRALVRIPTVGDRDPAQVDHAVFDAFLAELRAQFPLLHERLELTALPGHGLLFRWPGRSPADPVVLVAHLDVVPVVADDWRRPPFGAELADGAVWGRGTLDDKGPLVTICEAVETLLARGSVPARDVWLSFGGDEEVAGTSARHAVDELERRGVRPWFVLDEGGAVAGGALPGLRVPLAVVGVTEKGVVTLLLRAEGAGGHASTPARMGPTARIARAVLRLERAPLPARAPAPTLELFRRITPHVPRAARPLLARLTGLPRLLTRLLLAAGPEAAAMVRTTLAVTTLSGSPALNVIAAGATAGVNARVMVGDTVAGVVAHVRRTIADDGISIEVVERHEPSPVSPWDEAFGLLESTTAAVFPDAVTTPYVMMASADARHFTRICERVYRFAPLRMSRAQRASIHGADEHVRVADLLDGVEWYRRLLLALPGGDG
ncbi:M20/M25/M40 family metallo-hydrolase [Pseudonocardia humida]|uniref:M20/M25/M40 family metallo-hydrolase n=1 Tax=Pseudonocardia humida TaxID=2800819 RepID=A0ABT0ZXE7_9PSEU|nr:M20/M25/M40 family metallo-hydrolase [Pseudonocardia humida]MCO1655417.1 M20/M25/M40 family metallo-hydrolase [Pseudonocardia humida]